MVIDIAIRNTWLIQQLDVNNAFLQGTVTDEVYMEQPHGFIYSDKHDHVFHLHKAIYGLNKAHRVWYTELKTFILSLGFFNSLTYTSLFVFQRENQFVYLLIDVDEILVTWSSKSDIQTILALLSERFWVKDPEDLNYFLGIEAHQTDDGLHLSQCKYILDLPHKYDMMNAKPVMTLMVSSPKLTFESCISLTDPSKYRQLLGTPAHGHYFSSKNSLTLHAYSDTDWAGESDDYISTNSYIIYLGKHPISWTAKNKKEFQDLWRRPSIGMSQTLLPNSIGSATSYMSSESPYMHHR